MRCVPPIVLLFVVYYGGPALARSLTGVDIDSWDAVYFAIIALSLLHGAGMAEMMRGAVPVLGNATISMLKDGALAYSIGVVDITGQTGYLISMNLGAYVMETYLALAFIYWLLSLGTQKVFGSLTRRLQRGGMG